LKLFESEKTLAFLDIGPLSKGHSVRRIVPLRFANPKTRA
jgi:diadenosine tetraphosphate (Ap4A) HIT family hydrolase